MNYNSRWKSKIVGYFSVDERRNYVPDSSTLLYYNARKTKTVPLDLNEGIENAVRVSVVHERLDYVLKWIELNRSKIEAPLGSDKWIQPSFVCRAGLFTRILASPFTIDDDWVILAAKWKGTIYLYVDKTVNYAEAALDIREPTFVAWGLKFQQFMLSEKPGEVPDTSKPIIQAKEFRCVYQRRLGNHTILFDSTMKGVCSEKRLNDPLPLNDLKFIETRTTKIIEWPGHKKTLLKYKFLNWWSRALITNIENVVCGFRDEDGIVRELKTFSLDEMAEMSKDYWDPSACLHFAETFLTQMAKTVVDDCDKTIYRFQRTPSSGFTIQQTIVGTKLSPSDGNCVLPAWYTQETQNQ